MSFNDEFILNAGWYEFEKCHCNGNVKWKYRNLNQPLMQITVFPNDNGVELYIESRLVWRGTHEGLRKKINDFSKGTV